MDITAIVSMATGFWPVKAYHFYTTFFYCLGIVGVYFLMRAAGRARGFAFSARRPPRSMSPALLFMKDMRLDSEHLVPVRLTVLLRYGEGPHIAALALIPSLWHSRGSRSIAAAPPGWPSPPSPAPPWCPPISMAPLRWRCSTPPGLELLDHPPPFQLATTAILIPLLAYGLTAFWLTPSYLRITAHNMQYLPEHGTGTMWSLWVAIAVATAYVYVTRKLAQSRAERAWPLFIGGLVLFFSLDVLGHHYFGFNVAGRSHASSRSSIWHWVLGAALLLEWLWNRRHLRRARGRMCNLRRRLGHYYRLHPSRLARDGSMAGLPHTRRIPRHRLAVDPYARRARFAPPARCGSGSMRGMTSRNWAAVPIRDCSPRRSGRAMGCQPGLRSRQSPSLAAGAGSGCLPISPALLPKNRTRTSGIPRGSLPSPCCLTMARATCSTGSRAVTPPARAWWIPRGLSAQHPRAVSRTCRAYVDVVENGRILPHAGTRGTTHAAASPGVAVRPACHAGHRIPVRDAWPGPTLAPQQHGVVPSSSSVGGDPVRSSTRPT